MLTFEEMLLSYELKSAICVSTEGGIKKFKKCVYITINWKTE